MIRTEAKSLSSSSPNNILLHKWNGAYSISNVKAQKADIKEAY